jgi:alpha-amylase/alpha-mannosidase (GH57 family)
MEGEFILPWVRLHGVKDYFDLPELAYEFPNLKMTINIVPSLIMQLDEYVAGTTQDRIQKLTAINPEDLKEQDKKDILRLFFLCNYENMIMPYPRFWELHELANKHDLLLFENQDWMDLQVWYNLVWLGQLTRSRTFIKRLFDKGRNFTSEEKNLLMKYHLEVLSQTRQQLVRLNDLGQVEMSCSPLYHPILPLLCDSNVADQALENFISPKPPFMYPQDAEAQIDGALKFVEKTFNRQFKGFWPSEGSVSNQVIDLLAKAGLTWAATDEDILSYSLQNNYQPEFKYFPWRKNTPNGDLTLLFRDHVLSDQIGFVYARWKHTDAAVDFCKRLVDIRNHLVQKYGESILEKAVVPVILDGENCWEYYKDNGIPFRQELFRCLTESKELKTVTMSEAAQSGQPNFLPELKTIRAGSWINSDFRIWIGDEPQRRGWSALSETRKAVDERINIISEDDYKKALDEIYIAEGSDWFWWYFPDHQAENKPDFDVMFRWHLRNIYKTIGLEPPAYLEQILGLNDLKDIFWEQKGDVHPIIDGIETQPEEWSNAGCYIASADSGSMHQVGGLIDKFYFAGSKDKIFFRIDLLQSMYVSDKVEIIISKPLELTLSIGNKGVKIASNVNVLLNFFSFSKDLIIEIDFPKQGFISAHISPDNKLQLDLMLHSKTESGEYFYPRQGYLTINV